MADNEYAVQDDDLKGGGGHTAKPRGKYTGAISRAKTGKDKNGKIYIGFGLKVTHGKFKNGLAFENYLPLSRDTNAYQSARRNSFYKAIALKPGSVPFGAPGGPDVSQLDGTLVDFSIEHEFENVPGEQYSLVTSKSKKTAWVTDGWEDKLDTNGNLVVDGQVIKPKEVVTFYELSDDFEGVGQGDDSGSDDSADEDGWG